MARSYDSMRLRTQRAFDRRLTAEHRQLARQLAALVLRFATARSETGEAIIPPTRAARDALKAAMWEQVLKPYYIGRGTDALDGPNPRSPFALLLVEGITQATRIQAERQAAIVRRLVHDEEVLRWLTGPRPLGVREMHIQELLQPTQATLAALRGADGRIDTQRARDALVRPRGAFDAFYRWVDPNGYRLSDRIWRTSVQVRSRIDLLLEYHIAQGTSAVEIAALLEPFLTPQGLHQRTVRPYGTEGSYAARRLARTEITAAARNATVAASVANPFVTGVQWRLSSSHPRIDICDQYARGGPNGDGIYPPEQVPGIPHPHCLCSQLPVATGSVSDLVAELRADIRAARGNLIDAASEGNPARARALRGILSPEYLTRAIMDGSLQDAIESAVMRVAT
jgi:hypothetical protein